MSLPRIAHPLVFVLVLSLAATGLWAAAAEEEPAAAVEKEMVLDPSTGEMVEAPQYGGTVTYARPNLGEHTDVWYVSGWATHWISEVVEKLVIVDWALDRKINNLRTYDVPWSIFRGALAESWETPDATTIIAHIRQGVRWHDKAPMNGRELTASDVEFNFHRLWGLGSGFSEVSPMSGGVHEIVESVTATDDSTVVFKLTRPDLNALPKIFDQWVSQIYPPEVIREHGDIKDWRNLVGTGPMELTDVVEDASLKWTRVPDYWGFDEKFPQNRLPYVDEINALKMPDEAARLAALRSGRVDLLGTAGDSQLRSIDQLKSLRENNPEINMWEFEFRSENATAFNNVNKPPFDDVRVRRAMQMAVDGETIAETFFSGIGDATPQGKFANSKMGVGTPFEEWPEEIKQYYRYDPQRAKQLMAEAGYPDGFETTLYAGQRRGSSYEELLANYWREIGVEVEIRTFDSTQGVALRRDNPGGLIANIAAITYDAVSTLNWHTCANSGNPYAGCDPEIEALYEAANTASTVEEQNQLAKEANMRLVELHWVVVGPVTPQFNVAQPWVKGYNGEVSLSISGHYSTVLTRVWIDQDLKREMGF